MDADLMGDMQRDQQRDGTLEDAIQEAVDGALKDLHTGMPGIIRSFDPVAQTAVVQPAIRRLWVDEGWKDLPQCIHVPVQFPRGGNFIMTFPVRAGDTCWLVFGERAIDNWWKVGGVQEPAEYRLHDLSDGVAFLGVYPQPDKVANVATDALEIRTLDGSTVMRIENNQVIIGAVSGAQPAVKGDVLATILAAIKNHTHPETSTTTLVSPTLQSLPDPRSSKVKIG